ncbi:MAG TPA: acyl carrier protein [Kiloniellaceae bacterium]|nr:acyl carrier protein [Kiloniellaceae bacterium]
MTADAEQISREICDLLKPFNKANIALTGRTDLTTDLEMDSVAAMNLVMEIEDKYEIDIPINLLSDVTCADDLAKIVVKQLGDG